MFVQKLSLQEQTLIASYAQRILPNHLDTLGSRALPAHAKLSDFYQNRSEQLQVSQQGRLGASAKWSAKISKRLLDLPQEDRGGSVQSGPPRRGSHLHKGP